MNALILLLSMTVMGLAPNEVADLSRLRYCPCLYGSNWAPGVTR
jgi:hypothetical protein